LVDLVQSSRLGLRVSSHLALESAFFTWTIWIYTVACTICIGIGIVTGPLLIVWDRSALGDAAVCPICLSYLNTCWALDALCDQPTFRPAWCREHSAATATEPLQPLELACGSLSRSSCAT